MKPNNIIMYIIENKVIIWTKEKIIIESKSFKKSIYQGKIYIISEFVKNLEKLIKNNKVNSGLFNNSINVIIEPIYSPADIEILKNCLEKCSFNKLNIINITKLCELKRNNIWLLANNGYMYIIQLDYRSKVKYTYIDYKLFNNNMESLAKHLSTIIKQKKIIILGLYERIEDLSYTLEIFSKNKTYFINDFNNFIINKIKNTL